MSADAYTYVEDMKACRMIPDHGEFYNDNKSPITSANNKHMTLYEFRITIMGLVNQYV